MVLQAIYKENKFGPTKEFGLAGDSIRRRAIAKSEVTSSMVRYSIIPKLTNTGDVDFEGWFRQFLAHASRSKYDELVNSKPHPDLPSDGEATVYASMRKEQRKALRKHTKALNDLYMAFHNNNTGYAIIEKSKMDRQATTEENAETVRKWPRG